MPLRALGKVKEIVEAAGMDIAYAYEDLVFMDHNALLLQFAEAGNTVHIHVNKEADFASVAPALESLKRQALEHGFVFTTGNYYEIDENDNATIGLRFLEAI